ncbi:IS3 family transposase, partial [Enterococcus faecium]|nr:IS3 family transposase [Enterococcus faecium]
YGYRRMTAMLRKEGVIINEKRVLRVIRKLQPLVTNYHHKSRKYNSYALEEAISKSSDCLYRRTIHSDQGWAYQMHQYTDILKKHHIFQSMSRKGNCYDNSVMENFFGLLKQEVYYGNTFTTYEKLKTNINDWIIYYNQKRIKKKLNWLSPEEYRLKMIQ